MAAVFRCLNLVLMVSALARFLIHPLAIPLLIPPYVTYTFTANASPAYRFIVKSVIEHFFHHATSRKER